MGGGRGGRENIISLLSPEEAFFSARRKKGGTEAVSPLTIL